MERKGPASNVGWFLTMRGFLKIVTPKNEWFRVENPLKLDDLGVPLFQETSTATYRYTKKHHKSQGPPPAPKFGAAIDDKKPSNWRDQVYLL